MSPQKNRRTPTIPWIEELGVIEYPEFRPFLLGVVERCGLPPALCYDRSAVLDYLTETIGNYDDALEHFEFNVIGGYVGPTTPFFLDRFVADEGGGTAPSLDGSGPSS